MIIIVSFLVAFLCGSIPTGYLIIKRIYGIDIRTKGSGNIGSTNVKRIAGTKISLITQVIDILKGLLPVLISILIWTKFNLSINKEVYISVVALASILGHDFTPFLSFNGGKGVNTTLGAFVLIAPIPVMTGAISHIVLKKVTDIVAIRSIILGVIIPLTCVIMRLPLPIIVTTTISGIILIYRHKGNIKQLFSKENI
ncbi:hypothetical protein CINTURNW_2060 [Clostridium intestinale URNW]|uniref:Glycerol-3-phosphate acyltransferase n=2 Tax=Clostridium intestinale TaxID=36845 RepID=U2PXI6_9CLOT|nr:hypothetical protein CINTURNW_2060 [Clostridium intestinale URNW]